ncbi:hypothetical protein [Komagataeibacter diospyri]|uniref:hypothetical protein n=1 Tax=Komagataeibacter diospyri TaxID=1932662 RepID=UPI00114153A8|nr:hypothetical protein [Komagataeibacter diospyri]
MREDAQGRHTAPVDISASEIMLALFDGHFSCMNSRNGTSDLWGFSADLRSKSATLIAAVLSTQSDSGKPASFLTGILITLW